MRVDEIAVFIRVLEAGSFSAAARLLAMPPTTVSAKVAALEKRLGTQLIQRTTRSLRATAAGERYLARCQAALKQLEEAEAELAPGYEVPSGTLRITAPVVLGRSVLPEIIAAYRQAYPAVRVEVRLADRKVDLVREGIDLAIRVGPLKTSSLIARKLTEGFGGFYASRAYVEEHGAPQTLDDLPDHRMIGFSRDGNLTGRMLYRGNVVEVTIESAIVSDDFFMVRRFIEMGLGIGYLPSLMAEHGPDPLLRVLPECSSLRAGIYIVYPSQRFVPARIRSFVDFAVARAEMFA